MIIRSSFPFTISRTQLSDAAWLLSHAASFFFAAVVYSQSESKGYLAKA